MNLWHLFLRYCCCRSQPQDEESQSPERGKSSTKNEHELPQLQKGGQTNSGYESDDCKTDNFRNIKDTMVREEEQTTDNKQSDTSQLSRQQDSRDNLNKLNKPQPRRQLPQEFISNKDLNRVDTCAINANKKDKENQTPEREVSRTTIQHELPKLQKGGRTNDGYESDDSSTDIDIRNLKNTMVREEERIRHNVQTDASQPPRQQDSRDNLNQLIKPQFNRKVFRELISKTDFSRVDTYVINAGKELKSKKIFSVETIAQTITKVASTDLERFRAIWIWLCDNIEYDVEGLLGGAEKMTFSPDDVIRTGKGVCSGYAGVCFQLCKAVGIECREVSGYGKGAGYQLGQSCNDTNHAWNAVNIGGHWHLLDSCWGAGTVNEQVFNKSYNEFYFLTNPEDFINDHYPQEEKWQLLEIPITLKEFEKKVKKSKYFYHLGLTLIHPENCILVTESGEATISMEFSQPVDFTYSISRCNGSKQNELSKSRCLLTITKSRMKLRVIPPNAGSFNVQLYARAADATGVYNYVCSFLLECPNPKPFEHLPENPALCWGIKPNADALGVISCEYEGEIIELKSGTFQLALQTSRPLTVVCKLSHKRLTNTLAKRCLVTQTEADKITCLVLCPYTGYYTLSVYVRDYESGQGSCESAATFLLHCTGNPINLNELFPADLNSNCGPGISTSEAGLSQFSHTGPIVNAEQGKCNISFHNPKNVKFLINLIKDQRELPRNPRSPYNVEYHSDSKVTISLALPEPGLYTLSLFGNKTSSNSHYLHLCDFIIQYKM